MRIHNPGYGVVWYLLDGIQLASTDENDVVAEVPLPVAVRHARHLNKKHYRDGTAGL